MAELRQSPGSLWHYVRCDGGSVSGLAAIRPGETVRSTLRIACSTHVRD